MSSIGARLRRLRKEAGINQQQLAATLGVTQSMVSDYETKGVMFSADILVRLADTLGVTMEYLMRGESPPDQGETELVRLYRSMPDDSRSTLMATAKAFANQPVQRKRSNGA